MLKRPCWPFSCFDWPAVDSWPRGELTSLSRERGVDFVVTPVPYRPMNMRGSRLGAHLNSWGGAAVKDEEIAQDVARELRENPQLQEQVRNDPAAIEPAIAKAVRKNTPLEEDVWIYRIVVLALGLAVLLVIVGAVALALVVDSIPEVVTQLLTAIGSAAVGAIAGLLAPTPRGGQ
jgi:hypothetical protein